MKPRLEIRFSALQQFRFLLGKPYMPSEGEFLLNHSRSAILLALKSANLPQGARVGMMVYNCHTVMNAIAQAGCIPVFVDVNDDLTLDFDDLSRKALGLSALVVTHLFGVASDVRRIKEAYPDLLIVEDCAHASGIDNLYGDFATFSIGQGKLPSIGDGGVLQVRNERYKASVARLHENLPEYTRTQGAKLFFGLLAKSLLHSRWVYGWITLPLKQRRKAPSGKETIVMRKMCKGISAVYASEKALLPKVIKQRKQRAERMLEDLRHENVTDAIVGQNAFMLVVKCEEPMQLQQVLYRRGIDSATHFSNALVWAKEFGYQQGACPKVERMMNYILMIPTY